MEFKTIELKESIFANNDREADRLRAELKGDKTFLLNLMSSPGSGKTTTLLRTVERLREEMRIGVMEADIDSDVDARTMAGAGVRSWTPRPSRARGPGSSNCIPAACATWMPE